MGVIVLVLAIAVLLCTIVVVHEAGHFLFAKWSGIRVDEFAIGFGPRVLSFKRGDTVYALRILPFGGFVRMAGMTGLEGEADAGERNFYRASIPKKMVTIAAGGIFNLIFAGLLAGILLIPGVPWEVPQGGALYAAGLRDGDRVVALGAQPIHTNSLTSLQNDMHAATLASDGEPTTVLYQPGKSGECTANATDPQTHAAVCSATVKPYLEIFDNVPNTPLFTTLQNLTNKESNSPNLLANDGGSSTFVVDTINGKPVGTGDPGSLFGTGAATIAGHVAGDNSKSFTGTVSNVTTGNGVSGGTQANWRIGVVAGAPGESIPRALADGFIWVPTTIASNVSQLWSLVTTPNSGGVQGGAIGPIGIAAETATVVQSGPAVFFSWMALLSLSLGFVNLLPIPFLDGGRFVFIVLEWIRRRRVDPKIETAIHAAGLALLFVLVIYVSIGDIVRIHNGTGV